MAVVDHVDLAAGGHQDGLQAGLGDPVHRIQYDRQVLVADRVQIKLVDDRIQVPVDRLLLGDQPAGGQLLRRQGPYLVVADGVGPLGDRIRDREFGVPAAVGEDLETVVQGGIVGSGDRDPVAAALVTDRPHDHRGRRRAGHQGHRHPVTGQHLNSPPGRLSGQETPVIADHDPALTCLLGGHPVAQGLGDPADLGLGEPVADDLAPPTRAEPDHGLSLVIRGY